MTKPENILERLNNFINTQSDDFKSLYNKALNMTDRDLLQWVNAGCPEAILADITRDLKTDIIISCKGGKSSKISAAKRILKNVDNTRPLWQKASILEHNGKTVQLINDGYRFVLLAQPLENLPLNTPEDTKLLGIDIESFMKSARLYTNTLDTPSLTELKAELKTDKANKNFAKTSNIAKYNKSLYDFHNFNEYDSPVVDLAYLIDVIELIPDGKITYKDSVSPIYITNGTDEGLICPVRRHFGTEYYNSKELAIIKHFAAKRDEVNVSDFIEEV